MHSFYSVAKCDSTTYLVIRLDLETKVIIAPLHPPLLPFHPKAYTLVTPQVWIYLEGRAVYCSTTGLPADTILQRTTAYHRYSHGW